MRSGVWAVIVGAACLVGCGDGRAPPLDTPRSGGGVTTSDVPVVVDTRSPMQRACPAGATLRLQVWDVYAMPRKPNEDPWDTPSGVQRSLGCRVVGTVVASQLNLTFSGPLGAITSAFDRQIQGVFASAISGACGVAADWLFSSWEGPEMYTIYELDAQEWWRTSVSSPDRWVTHVETDSAGRGAFVEAACGERLGAPVISVMDEDVFNDDLMANVRVPVEQVSPQAICGGWWIQTIGAGVALILYRVGVDGAGQNCAGLSPTTYEDIVVRGELGGGGQGAMQGGVRVPTNDGVSRAAVVSSDVD
jgi:hypothetical protein